jgi:hypothetical protein
MDEVRPGEPKTAEEPLRRGFLGGSETARRRAARLIALAVDALQIVVFPAFFPGLVSPFENVLDVATGIILTLLLGWHVAFLPTFIAEMVPFVDLFPTWTLAVLFVTRKKLPKE